MHVINFFDNIDKTFSTLLIIMVATYLLYWLMMLFKKPMLLGGLLSGVIISWLHLPKQIFDIQTCSIMGDAGIVLFMMLLGNSIHKDVIYRKQELLAPLLGVIITFLFGVAITPIAMHFGLFNAGGMKPIYFSLIFGLAFSMSAFPIISLFLEQTNIVKLRIGSLALVSAAINDVFFWIVLGIVLLLGQDNDTFKTFEPLVLVAYGLFVVILAPRIISFLLQRLIKNEQSMMAFLICGCFFFAVLADLADLHQIFGGFLFGLLLPKNNPLIVSAFNKLRNLIYLLLLPVYFVGTGLKAGFDVAAHAEIIYMALIITALALLIRYLSAMLVGRILCYNFTQSMLLGSILNIRGVVEVALLNVGIEVGVLTHKTFSILVLMTIITTWIALSLSLKLSKKVAMQQ